MSDWKSRANTINPENKSNSDWKSRAVNIEDIDREGRIKSQLKEKQNSSTLDAIAAGVNQGGALGWADEIEGYSVALGKKLKGDERPFQEIAKETISKARNWYKKTEEEHPVAYNTAMVAGSIGTPVNKLTGGLAVKSPVITAGIEGGLAGAGIAEEQKALGGAVGTLFGVGTGTFLKAMSKLFGKAGQELAARKATESLNPTARQEAKILGMAKNSKEINKKFTEIGEELLDRDIIRLNKEDMYGRLLDENTFVGQKIQTIHSELDNLVRGQKLISRTNVANKLREKANLLPTDLRSQVLQKNALNEAADLLEEAASKEGDVIGFSEALNKKYLSGLEAYQSSPKFSASPNPINETVSRTTERALADEIKQNINKLNTAESRELALQLTKLNKSFSNLQKAGDILQGSVGRHAGIQSLQNLTVGSAVAISHHPLAGLGATLGKEALRKYGKAVLAKTAKKFSSLPGSEKISKGLSTAARLSGRFIPFLGE